MKNDYFLAPVERLFAAGDAPSGNAGDTTRWIQAFPYDTWDHPIYGKTTVDLGTAKQYVKNFKDNVRGQELATNYDHGEDKSKGNKASGWIKDMEARKNGLFLKVDFTPTAIQELKNGEWRYFSSESYDSWVHPHTGKKYEYVITGGALTNKPWVKGMLPINFSEVLTEDELKEAEKIFTEWSTEYKNNLPDSAFLYVESGGKKDSEGKTTPRTLRHLPYKDENGKLDEPHVRDAISRAPQMVGLSESLKKSLQAKAQRILSGMKKMSELSDTDQIAFAELLEKSGLTVVDESKEWEHSEPGTGSPPVPRTDGDGHDELDRESGSRRPDLPTTFPDTLNTSQAGTHGMLDKDGNIFAETSSASTALRSAIAQVTSYIATAPTDFDKAKAQMWLAEAEALLSRDIGEVGYADVRNCLSDVPYMARSTSSSISSYSEGGKYMGELTEKDVRGLMRMFDVDDEAKLVEAAQLKFGEYDELKRAATVQDQEQKFAEQYPEMWEEHNKLMLTTRDNDAKAFSESVSKIRRADGYALKDTKQGLSAKAINEISEVHRKFAEGSATVKDFEEAIKAVVNGGIVEFGEVGATKEGDDYVPEIDNTSANGVASARKLFAELVQKELDGDTTENDYTTKLMRASDQVAKKHPELAETYRVTLPA